MSPSLPQLGNLGPLEAPEAPPQEETGEAGLAAANYHGADATCDKCAHFDGSQCVLFQAPVDTTGHCDRFEPGSEAPNEEAAESPIEQSDEANEG